MTAAVLFALLPLSAGEGGICIGQPVLRNNSVRPSITTQLHNVFGVVLPPDFVQVQRRLDLFNLNVFALPGLHMQCFGMPSFFSQLLGRAKSSSSSRSPSRSRSRASGIDCINLHHSNRFSMCVFRFNEEGTVIPLHNHPHMTVMSKLLYGSLRVRAFDCEGNCR